MKTVQLLVVRSWGTLRLPPSVRLATDAGGGTSPDASGRDGGGGGSGPCMRILLVEDDGALASMYRLRLERAGHSVVVAADGEDGLNRIRSEDYDLVFLDIGLPKIDGLAVLEAVRADEALSSLPVVILSNYSEPELVERGRKLGVVEYLVKAETTPGQVADRVREFRDSPSQ